MAKFLLLRPEGKCQQSCIRFEAEGIDVVGIPLIDIVAQPDALTQWVEKLHSLPAQSKVIFISTSAARLAVDAMTDKEWPSQLSYFAVGNSTAALLRQAGVSVQVPQQQDSEGLLTLAELNAINGQSVLLLKGEGGRPLLAQTLTERGAHLIALNLYRRQRVRQPKPTGPWKPEQIQCIISTSGELMAAAFDQFDPSWLCSRPWILVSDRLMQEARERGITHVLRSDDASDEALIKTARHFLEQQSMSESDQQPRKNTPQKSTDKASPKAAGEKASGAIPASTTNTSNPSDKAGKNTATRAGRSGFLWLLMVLNLLMVVALAAAGYWAWQQFQLAQQAEDTEVQDLIEQAQQQRQVLAQQLNQRVTDTTQAQQATQQQQQQLQQQLASFEQALSANQQQLQKMQGRRPNDWLLAEAAYLVRMAGRKVWLEKDLTTAVLLLESADSRLEDLNDPSLIPVRQVIADDVQALRQINPQPLTKLALQLGALANQVDTLPLDMVVLPEAEQDGSDQTLTDSVSDWRTNLKRSWRAIVDDFVTVRRRTEQTKPLLDDSQQWLVREQLRLYLLQAQHGLVKEEVELYPVFLREALSILQKYFAPQAPAVAGFRARLQELLETNIRRDYPRQLQSSLALEDVLQQRLSSQYQGEQP
ncbi:uroporphyrinogen-III C-methyltransferase [Lacimicrobium sp. SS2-24]|uniref:uroporphyrinogen-III C-methyltransferase n=1 Tax=Lacimicrobium sp. SS2-24 TaxID=2005569 RepID=UPI000B4BE6F0|nr:uroporphyrinogen-III C-methyltransferase [Lacimicrobium sp. SS2-24]